jgi:PAS domain S-box-containing protein
LLLFIILLGEKINTCIINYYGGASKLNTILNNVITNCEQLFDLLPDAIFALNSDRKVIAWNKEMERLTGKKRSDVMGKNNQEYSIPIYGYRRKLLIDLLFEDDSEVEKTYEKLCRLPNGVIIGHIFIPSLNKYLWGKASPILDENGKIIGAIETIRDVTEFIDSRKFSSISQRILDNMKELVWVKDLNNRFLYANKTFCDKLGLTIEEIKGKRSDDIFDPSSEFEKSDEIAKTRPYHFIGEIKKGDASVWLKVCKLPLIDGSTIVGTLGTANDITHKIIEDKMVKEELMVDIEAWKMENEKVAMELRERITQSIKRLKNSVKKEDISEIEVY